MENSNFDLLIPEIAYDAPKHTRSDSDLLLEATFMGSASSLAPASTPSALVEIFDASGTQGTQDQQPPQTIKSTQTTQSAEITAEVSSTHSTSTPPEAVMFVASPELAQPEHSAFAHKPLEPFSIVAAIAPYCDTPTLFALSSVSRQARDAVTSDTVMKPLCEKLGVAHKPENSDSLISFTSAAEILDQGYVSRERSAYYTYTRAFRLLRPVLHAPDNAVTTIGSSDPVKIAKLLASAKRLSTTLPGVEEEVAALNKTIEREQGKVLSDLVAAVKDGRGIAPIAAAWDVWISSADAESSSSTFSLYDEASPGARLLQQKALDILTGESVPELDSRDAYAFGAEVEDSKHVSKRKLEAGFQAAASYLLGIKSKIEDPDMGIPQGWRGPLWTSAIDLITARLIIYMREVLESAATDISELEYLNAVPRLVSAARILSENSVLADVTVADDTDLKKYVDVHITRAVVDEFCERQAVHITNYAKERVIRWQKSVAQRESETEEFLWSSVPKKSDKTNFIASFKWAFIKADEDDDKQALPSVGGPASSVMTERAENKVPETEFEAQTAVLVSKLRGMESLVSIELAIDVLERCREAIHRLKALDRATPALCEPIFTTFLDVVGRHHIQKAFEKAIKVLNSYDPKRYGRLMVPMGRKASRSLSPDTTVADRDGALSRKPEEDNEDADEAGKCVAVEPLAVFTELVNVGDLVQQMVHVFFEAELITPRIVRKSDFGATSVSAKRRFEQMLDDMLAEGMSRGIDVLMDQVEFTLVTEQLGSDYRPLPMQPAVMGPTPAAQKVIDLVRSHLDLLRDSTEKSLFDVFQQEVGMRLFTALSKHLKSQTISVDGAITLISDINAYYAFILTLKQRSILPYYQALKQIGQLYLIDKKDAKQLGMAISDVSRYDGVVTTEDLVEFMKRREDWPLVRGKVEKVLYGIMDCIIC